MLIVCNLYCLYNNCTFLDMWVLKMFSKEFCDVKIYKAYKL